MRLRTAVILPLLLAVLAAPATPGSSDKGDPYADFDPVFRTVLERFDQAQEGVTSLSAGFVEQKEIGLLKNTVVQEGRFYHTKPDKFLWEYVAPEPKMYLMNGKSLVAYYPRQKQAEEMQGRMSRKVVKFFGLGQIFADLREYYDLSLSADNTIEGTNLIVMKPKSKIVARRLYEVRIWIDSEMNQVSRLEYLETDGDRTTFTFDDIEVNPEIVLAKYEIDLPADVRVSNSFSNFFTEKGR